MTRYRTNQIAFHHQTLRIDPSASVDSASSTSFDCVSVGILVLLANYLSLMHCFCVVGSVFACGLKEILLIDDRTSALPIICQKTIQRLRVRVDSSTTILLLR